MPLSIQEEELSPSGIIVIRTLTLVKTTSLIHLIKFALHLQLSPDQQLIDAHADPVSVITLSVPATALADTRG